MGIGSFLKGMPIAMDNALNQSLFETPPGIRVIPAAMLIDDPEATMAFSGGDLEESEQLLSGFDPEASIRNTRGPVSIHGGDRVVTPARSWYVSEIRVRNRASGSGSHPGGARAALTAATGPGARFVYALCLMKVTLGVLGLALTWQDPRALAVAGIFATAAGILLWVFWRSWLGGFPYVYRLLTSLGEDAENLVHWRLFRRDAVRFRSLYR